MLEAYTAGFLDADGSIRLAKHRAKDPEHLRYPMVELFNCDRKLLERIQNRWGGLIKARKRKANHNVSYTLILRYDGAYEMLKDVSPYMMHTKKALRAKLILAHYKDCTPRTGKYNPEMIAKKLAFVDSVMGIVMRGSGAYQCIVDGPELGSTGVES